MEGNQRTSQKPKRRTLRALNAPSPANDLSTSEAASALGLTERTVRRAIARGELAAVRRGSSYRINSEELARYSARVERSSTPKSAARMTLLPIPEPPHVPAPLPAPLSSFVGRESEQATLTALLAEPSARLITLTGPGGVGKTRLAINAAASVCEHFPDGIAFIPLATVARPEDVVPAIADALGLRELATPDRRAQIHTFFRAKRLLLLLDNFEQILGAAPEVSRLAAEAPNLTILVTSRAPLRVSGEREMLLAPLALPHKRASLDDVAASEAGQLFIARAREHDPSFSVDEDSASQVAEICDQLDGIPLALELAAARVKLLPPRQLRAHLQQRLPLLTKGPRDAPQRHTTMRDAIAWSYDLLSAEEQCLFQRLAVFVGGCTLEAAASVSRHANLLDHLSTLNDHSLLMREMGAVVEPRYRMLETIREYGLDQLHADEALKVRSAHARFFLDLAWDLRPMANTRARYAPLDQFAADENNVRAALVWLDAHGESAEFVRMVVACYTFFFARSHFREAAEWLERAMLKSSMAPDADRARLLVGLAELLMIKGQYSRAVIAFGETLSLVRAAGTSLDLTMALISSGAALNYDGRYEEGAAHLGEALSLSQEIEDESLRAAVMTRALANICNSARGQGDLAAATAYGEDALQLCLDHALDLAATRILADLGDIAKDQGDYALATSRYLASLEQTGDRGEMRSIAEVLSGMASVATAWGRYRAALLLLGAASAMRERIGLSMFLPIDLARFDRDRAALHASLGEREAAAALAEGHSLSLGEAVAVAAALVPPQSALRNSETPLPDKLTSRELDVLRLMAASRTDREIAEALFLSPRTVNWHVSTILGKLGVASRRAAVARAHSDGLL